MYFPLLPFLLPPILDRKSTRLNSSHVSISYAVFCLKKKIVYHYPQVAQPLARPHREDPRMVEAWDLVIDGYELGTAFSELIDPVIERERLTSQSEAAAAGDEEAMQLDHDFLRALEYGAPPTGGLGMGVDRLVMLLTGTG